MTSQTIADRFSKLDHVKVERYADLPDEYLSTLQVIPHVLSCSNVFGGSSSLIQKMPKEVVAYGDPHGAAPKLVVGDLCFEHNGEYGRNAKTRIFEGCSLRKRAPKYSLNSSDRKDVVTKVHSYTTKPKLVDRWLKGETPKKMVDLIDYEYVVDRGPEITAQSGEHWQVLADLMYTWVNSSLDHYDLALTKPDVKRVEARSYSFRVSEDNPNHYDSKAWWK